MKVVVVLGPTASGKTGLAIKLAGEFAGEIVSADSMQIYREMNIGTAKPTDEEMCNIPHHMIDVVSVRDSFSVWDYCDMAHKIINDINNRGKLPIIAGGTGLYIDSLIGNLQFGESDSDEKVREELFQIAENQGNDELFKLLLECDPESALVIHKNNVKRVVRAIEYQRVTGEKFSNHKIEAASTKSPYTPIYLMVDWDREVLYERINKRVDQMIDMGLVEEARGLYDRNLNRSSTAFCGIGYKELFEYFDGKCRLSDAILNIKQGSRRYAKRQLTWFRKNPDIIKISPGNLDFATEAVRKFLDSEDIR